VLVLLDDLLERFARAYEAAKAARAGVDFEDLELRVRDLLADPAVRARWAGRFGRFATLPDRLAAAGYLPERFGPRITLYARPGCESA